MKFRDFETVYAARPAFTVREVELRFPGFDDRQLHYWQGKGWVRPLRRPFYRILDRPWTLHERQAVANMIYAPSYISLESALSHYGFIPEGVFHLTSITSRHTRSFELDGITHSYRSVRPSWFFGYAILEQGGVPVRMAEPEKALLDMLHLNPALLAPEDFDGLRLDPTGIKETIRPLVFQDYMALSTNKALISRARTFQRWLHDHAG